MTSPQLRSKKVSLKGNLCGLLAVWLSGNALASINVVVLCQTWLVSRWVTVCWTGKISQYVTSQQGRLSLLPSVGW